MTVNYHIGNITFDDYRIYQVVKNRTRGRERDEFYVLLLKLWATQNVSLDELKILEKIYKKEQLEKEKQRNLATENSQNFSLFK